MIAKQFHVGGPLAGGVLIAVTDIGWVMVVNAATFAWSAACIAACRLPLPVASLAAMPALTQRFSCEFAIRPFVERHRELTFAQLADWVADPNVHVRRLVSEGTRPRLPWGRRLTALQRDPRPLWPLLERLRDDPELYVRRSVANSLNDVAKDHPALAVEVANRWLADAPPGREWIVRHALRTLIKQGDRSALRALGYGTAKVDAVRFEVAPRRLALGDALTLRAELRSTARSEQQLVIDYAVHHRRQNGTLSPKVFKWRRAALPVGGTLELEKRHALRPVTTRRYHAGRHRVELLVNGRSCGSRDFDLRL